MNGYNLKALEVSLPPSHSSQKSLTNINVRTLLRKRSLQGQYDVLVEVLSEHSPYFSSSNPYAALIYAFFFVNLILILSLLEICERIVG